MSIAGIPVTLTDPNEDPGQEGKQLPLGSRRPSLALHKTGPPASRTSLRMSAGWWRSMQYMGSTVHFLASPRPPAPAFDRTIPSTLSQAKGNFRLYFYTPKGYDAARKKKKPGVKFPAVVNFHGGGFTIGGAMDDARFARVVLETCGAVFISVEYRLAPEYPFPVAVEDGADALLYVINHADELHIDPLRLATSGFSAGGNLALTSPLRLRSHLDSPPAVSVPIPEHKLVAVATWYPITDYTITRAERRASSKFPEKALPSTFTDLFDASYLYPPDLDVTDPYLSPSQASDDMLKRGIPPDVLFYTCEWDMLLREGADLAARLEKEPMGKKVKYTEIPGVPHGWDKGPSPIKPPERSEELYLECCQALKDIFDRS